MKWMAKAALKWVTPISRQRPKSFDAVQARFEHIRRMAEYLVPSSLTEIGAGWDACSALCWYKLGVKKQYLIDIKPRLQFRLVQPLCSHLGMPVIKSLDDLKGLGIHYMAPSSIGDAPEVEAIFSNSVLEHIPATELPDLLRECKAPYALHHIDYKDHYASFDKSITPYNFYRYGGLAWMALNPPAHHQNRLRQTDYEWTCPGLIPDPLLI